jgi:hypothetical protein
VFDVEVPGEAGLKVIEDFGGAAVVEAAFGDDDVVWGVKTRSGP